MVPQNHISGLAAYDAIIDALKRDEDYPENNQEVISFRCMALGTDGIHLLKWKRCAAKQFLNSMLSDDLPDMDALQQAADYYGKELI